MEKTIEEARRYLLQRYRELYGSSFQDFAIDRDIKAQTPVWLSVSKDLSPSLNSDEQNALLLDPEIGIAVYLLHYDRNVDIRAQMARALGLRSRLLRCQAHDKKSDDPKGSWRIVLHWLVDISDKNQWIEDAASLRRDSAHLEEIPIDAIIRVNGDWFHTFELHGFPRLLIRLRFVLRQRTPTEVINWSSADERVREQLENFSDKFRKPLEKKYAEQIFEFLRSEITSKDEGIAAYPPKPTRLSRLEVRDFRNLQSIDLTLGSDSEFVKASVVHGPNGSGKSSLYEALEFSLCGASSRLNSYLDDNDVTSRRSYEAYVEDYLQPVGNKDASPTILLDAIKKYPQEKTIEVKAVLDTLKGSLLSQEKSHKFLDMSSAELSAEILGDFSQLATRVQLVADQNWEKARTAQQSLLSQLSLSKNITKTETACSKIVEQVVDEAIQVSPSLVLWLEDSRLGYSPLTSVALERIKEWQQINERFSAAVSKISKLRSSEEIKSEIKTLLYRMWDLQNAITMWVSEVTEWRSTWPEGLIEKLRVWGNWLQLQSKAPLKSIQGRQAQPMIERREVLERELAEITIKGQVLSARENHFRVLDDFLHRTWAPIHPNECPTCSTDLTNKGGVLETVAALSKENENKRDFFRKRYSEIQSELKEILRVLGQEQLAEQPLSDENRSLILETLSGKLPSNVSLESTLSVITEHERLLDWLTAVEHCPAPHEQIKPDARDQMLQAIAEKLVTGFNDVDITFEAPNAWKSVRDTLNKSLAGVLDRHLPSTIVGIWRELVWNLTPAPWQLPGQLSIKVESRRSNNEASIRLEADAETPRYARYIVNEAEVHTFGLAWFFVRYVTSGRFRHALLALDDPAQEMDQTTYRDLCRFLETLLRLHKVHEIPLTLLVLLHQDERALDLARATDALLYRLFWNLGHPDLEKGVYLYSADYHIPTPFGILTTMESTPV